jgi:23S rRNA pseudouridine2605 synthase
MRINRYVALAKGIGRRQADKLIVDGLVKVNDLAVDLNYQVLDRDKVTLSGDLLTLPDNKTTIILNKPVGYVVSRRGQGSQTIYTLLPKECSNLNPVGRLDKDSSGLLILSNNGQLVFELSHPSFNKKKIYEVTLDKPLKESDVQQLDNGVRVEGYISKLSIQKLSGNKIIVSMTEGRNRQIRRTFNALGYLVTKLHRTNFCEFTLGNLKPGEYQEVAISQSSDRIS